LSSPSSLPPQRRRPVGAAVFSLAVALAAALPVCLPAAGASAAVAETGASGIVRQFYDALLSTMKDGPQLRFQGRFERLTPAVTQAFDLPAMTRIAAGAQWPAVKPEDQQRLIDAFSRFSVANYAANFDSFGGERFEVVGEAPAPSGTGGVIVETRLVPKSGDPVQLNYLLRPGKSGLRILDVYVNGTISELASRRSEFASVLNTDGADGLTKLLETKVRDLAKK